MKTKAPTKHNFDSYFQEGYGDRWPSLRSALLLPKDQIMRDTEIQDMVIPELESIFSREIYSKSKFELAQTKTKDQCKKYYIMDPASIICANCLEINPDDFVLDMCAAPGGKSLILLEKLETGTLWCNEISANRRGKLKSIIQDHVPKHKRDQVFIKGKDGNRYGIAHPDTFDKVLVDAPCSGEQHLLQSPKELEKWSLKRTKRLSTGQYSLLCSALLACKSGGQIVYSTCSISPFENDNVIEKLLNKKSERVELDLPEFSDLKIEQTKYGYILLPDQSNAGPIFFSRLKKK